jgi:hypothetical protein
MPDTVPVGAELLLVIILVLTTFDTEHGYQDLLSRFSVSDIRQALAQFLYSLDTDITRVHPEKRPVGSLYEFATRHASDTYPELVKYGLMSANILATFVMNLEIRLAPRNIIIKVRDATNQMFTCAPSDGTVSGPRTTLYVYINQDDCSFEIDCDDENAMDQHKRVLDVCGDCFPRNENERSMLSFKTTGMHRFVSCVFFMSFLYVVCVM